jgi:hypothetical protein
VNAPLLLDPGRVEIRCEDCARDLGRAAPVLMVAALDTRGWELIGLGQRRPSARPGPKPIPGLVVENTSRRLDGRTINQHHVRGRVVELACRRCKRSGRRRRRVLYELADQARAAGTSDAYLSLS